MISYFIVLLGAIAGLVGWVWITCSAGRESLPWGLACLFFGPTCLAYPIMTDRFEKLTIPCTHFTIRFGVMFILPAIGVTF